MHAANGIRVRESQRRQSTSISNRAAMARWKLRDSSRCAFAFGVLRGFNKDERMSGTIAHATASVVHCVSRIESVRKQTVVFVGADIDMRADLACLEIEIAAGQAATRRVRADVDERR